MEDDLLYFIQKDENLLKLYLNDSTFYKSVEHCTDSEFDILKSLTFIILTGYDMKKTLEKLFKECEIKHKKNHIMKEFIKEYSETKE